jgi:hypothetical protein
MKIIKEGVKVKKLIKKSRHVVECVVEKFIFCEFC